MLDFFDKMVRYFQKFFWKGARIMKKIYHNRAKNLPSRGADSFLKIKTDDNRARFSKNQQNNE